MFRFSMLLLNMKTNNVIYSVSDCFFSDGENILQTMNRFAVKNGRLNPELWDLEAFKKYDINIPLNLNFNNVLALAIENERDKVINMCFKQLASENDYSSAIINDINDKRVKNYNNFESLKDFYIIKDADIDFISKQLLNGFKNGHLNENNKYNKGIKDFADYYQNNDFSDELVMIIEAEDFSLEQTHKDFNMFSTKEILSDESFCKFVREYDDSGDFLSADEYLSYFLESDYLSEKVISFKNVVNYIVDNNLNDNIITKKYVTSI